MNQDLRLTVERLKAVAHPLRLRVLALVAAGELCVCQVAEVLETPQSSVSEALRELRRAGFLGERKEGRWVYVSVPAAARRSPLLQGILAEAMALAEAGQDRERATAVQALGVAAVCCKVQGGANQEVTHG